MTSQWAAQKRAVAQATRRMAEQGYSPGTSGNISVRLKSDGPRNLIAITPSGRRKADLKEEDIVVVDFEVEPVEGLLAPSSETLLHIGIYKARPEVRAVIHTHSVYASAAAVAGIEEIPPIIDEMVVLIGGAIRVSEYAFPGTQELADRACAALGERTAALIGNHGAVGVGRDLAEAMDVCALTERLAKIFVLSSLLGGARALPDDAVEAEASIFRMRWRGHSKDDGTV